MIPRKIYNHMIYANGGDACGPSAQMGEYDLTREYAADWSVRVVAHKGMKRISLRQVPDSTEADWIIADC